MPKYQNAQTWLKGFPPATIIVICLMLFPFLAFAANSKPAIGTITPSSGSSTTDQQTYFTTTFTDADGWQNIQFVYFIINTSTSGSKCFYGYYNQNTNKLYLRNDANNTWFGGFAPGSSNIIENSYVKLNCANTTITGSGTTLSVKWAVAFKPIFYGSKKTYLYVKDDANAYKSWTQKGTWISNRPPVIGTITPASGSTSPNQQVMFTTTFSDPDGYKNIQYGLFLINTSASQVNCLYAYYNQNTNKFYLANDTGSSWLGGFTPKSTNVIENSYVKLDCSKSTVSGSGTTLTVKWAVTFKSTFGGAKNTYLYVKDDYDAYVNWAQKGTYTINVPDTTAPTGTIKINNEAQYVNSTAVTLTLSASDNTGGSGLSQMQFSNDNSTWPAAENYAATKSWTLATGDGQKTVYVKYKDNAGNWSQSYSDTIILDTTVPTISVASVATPTNQDVTLSLAVNDNLTPAAEIQVSGNNSPYTTEGIHNVTITATDKAGNSATKDLSFTIDKTPPNIIITSPQDGVVVEDTQITLTGTIDGASFSDSVTLAQEGENTITKTTTDAAGNVAAASIKVNLYRGTLITPAGGEVVSPDGKVKLTIPEEALTENAYIKILNVNKDTLEFQTPQSDTLLSVVECKPYGLVFQKPVTITYTLSQAEIPGTSVELGFYDYIQDKIIPTGQISTVATDSYSIHFSIMHFSTYAALKSMISSGAPIGAGVKIPLPDMFTGSFGHSIPLTVSPGRKGMQPSLALNYRSSNSNSWLGIGFSLNPGYIVRSTRLGPPSYDDIKDTFYFVTDAGTTELVHLTDNLYQAKIESSFAKFFKETDDSWKIIGKDGSIIRLGQTTNSKEISQSGTYSWFITKAIDTNKNYIEYTYIKDQGKCYLNRVDYTGNDAGFSPTNSVEFFLESREDIPSSYISTSKISTAKRLKEIQVKVNSELVWKYILEYEYSADTNRSLLKSIVQQGADGKELPQQNLKYQSSK
ncbi:MAG: Ig-like domain-containing protein [Candidatus Omnitrophica bacterium]|nr:Ig-like domain-containing protein [Candidatus Omnitrophota bacterium]